MMMQGFDEEEDLSLSLDELLQHWDPAPQSGLGMELAAIPADMNLQGVDFLAHQALLPIQDLAGGAQEPFAPANAVAGAVIPILADADRCWGAALSGSGAECTPGFKVGRGHFKNKFCGACAIRVRVPATRVRACTTELGAALSISTKQQAGFWKVSPPNLAGGRMRVVNNTMMCTGPWLACYEQEAPDLAWAPMPEEWLDDGREFVTFRFSKGTLVPLVAAFAAVRSKPRGGRRASSGGESSLAVASTPSSVGPEASRSSTPSGESDTHGVPTTTSDPDSGSFSNKRRQESLGGKPGSSKRRQGPVNQDNEGETSSSSELSLDLQQRQGSRSGKLPMASSVLVQSAARTEQHIAFPSLVMTSSAPPPHGVLGVPAKPAPPAQPEPPSFVDAYLQSQKQLIDLITARLASSEHMPHDERDHLESQLALAESLVAAARGSTLAHWRALDPGERVPYERLDETADATIGYDSSGESEGSEHEGLVGTAPHHHRGKGKEVSAQGGESSLRVLVIASGGHGLSRPRLEASASIALLGSAGHRCLSCDAAAGIAKLDRLLCGQSVMLFSGHADASVRLGRPGLESGARRDGTLAFARGDLVEAVDAEALTRIIAAHSSSLRFVLLNGCRSLHLALRLAHAGIQAVACWETAVPDEAATHFGVGIARALAHGGDMGRVFDAGIAAVLSATELAPSGRAWVPRYALVCPAAANANMETGRLPDGHPSGGRVAAGLPWLIRQLPSHAMHGVPSLTPRYAPRSTMERQAIAAISAHRLRAASHTPADGATPRAMLPGALVLLGPTGCGKTTLATWLCHDLRTHSAFPDGIHFLSAPEAGGGAPLHLPPAGRQRCLLVVEDALEAPARSGSFEQMLLVTTRHPHVASALEDSQGGCCIIVVPALAMDPTPKPVLGSPGLHAQSHTPVELQAPVGSPLQPVRQEDSESMYWLTAISAGFYFAFFAFLYESQRRASAVDSAADSGSEHRFAVVPWYILMVIASQYISLIAISPANERAIFSLVELFCWWGIAGVATNAYMAICYARGACLAEDDGAGRMSSAWSSDEGEALGTVHASNSNIGVPVDTGSGGSGMGTHETALSPTSWAGLVFHSTSFVACITFMGCLLTSFQKRPDAPRFRKALQAGMARFKAEHGYWLGTLYSMSGTGLPTSTFSYYLVDASYFSSTAQQVYDHAFRSLMLWQVINAVSAFGYYAALCAFSQGALAERYSWVASTGVLYVVSFVACQPANRRRVRKALFPWQRLEGTGVRV